MRNSTPTKHTKSPTRAEFCLNGNAIAIGMGIGRGPETLLSHSSLAMVELGNRDDCDVSDGASWRGVLSAGADDLPDMSNSLSACHYNYHYTLIMSKAASN